MFDVNHDGKIFWSEFKKGIERCMLDDESEFDSFIFHFFSLNEYVETWFPSPVAEVKWILMSFNLCYSIFLLVSSLLFWSQQRLAVIMRTVCIVYSLYFVEWVQKWGNEMNELVITCWTGNF